MDKLSDEALTDTYIQAKQIKLDSQFIRQLEEEINKRSIHIEQENA